MALHSDYVVVPLRVRALASCIMQMAKDTIGIANGLYIHYALGWNGEREYWSEASRDFTMQEQRTAGRLR